MTKFEKCLAAGAIVVAGGAVAYCCPALAPQIKIAAMVGLRNVFR